MAVFKRLWRRLILLLSSNQAPPDNEEMVELSQTPKVQARLAEYDTELLERAQVFWRMGQWEAVVGYEFSDIQLHPDRAKIAALIASAHFQLGKLDEGKSFLQFSRENGYPDAQIAKILAAGIHNSLGIAALAAGNETLAVKHLNLAIGDDFSPEERLPLINFRSAAEIERQRKREGQNSAIAYRL